MIRRTDTTMDIKKEKKRTKNGRQNTTEKTKDLSNTNLIKTGENSNAQEGYK